MNSPALENQISSTSIKRGQRYSPFVVSRSAITSLLAAAMIIASPGCGGGSSGTGTRVFEGTVQNSNGEGLAGVTVTIVATQESTTTDENGNFAVASDVSSGDVQLQVEGDNVDAVVTVPNVSEEPSTVSVDIEVPDTTPSAGSIMASNVEVVSKIVGECDGYFENNRVIRQSNATPPKITCIAKSVIKGDGALIPGLPVIVQVRRCPRGSIWRTVATGGTGSGMDAGVAQVPFTYIDDEKNCAYRIIAPFGVDGLREVVYEVDTFTKQAFDAMQEPVDTPAPAIPTLEVPASETPVVVDPIP